MNRRSHRRLFLVFATVIVVILATLPSIVSTQPYRDMLWTLQCVRIVVALSCGMILGSTGAALQGALSNPLADPYILGVSAGAGLGATIAIACVSPLYLSVGLPIGALLGSLITTGILAVGIRSIGSANSTSAILVGVSINALFSALTMVMMFLVGPKISWVMLWLMGDFSQASVLQSVITLASAVIGIGLLSRFSTHLDALTLGDDIAHAFGIPVNRARLHIITICSILAGISVASGGMIGFVGLITPHLCRQLGIVHHRHLIILSALGSGTLLLLCDRLASVSIFSTALPIGVVTALIGAPFFIGLLYSRRHDSL